MAHITDTLVTMPRMGFRRQELIIVHRCNVPRGTESKVRVNYLPICSCDTYAGNSIGSTKTSHGTKNKLYMYTGYKIVG